MLPWHAEIVELHDFFERYFAGTLPSGSIDRLEAALAPDFTIVSPGGVVSSRSETIDAISAAYRSRDDLRMSIERPQLLVDTGSTVVARYIEVHRTPGSGTERVATVVFLRADGAPNGLLWQTVHETWLPESA